MDELTLAVSLTQMMMKNPDDVMGFRYPTSAKDLRYCRFHTSVWACGMVPARDEDVVREIMGRIRRHNVTVQFIGPGTCTLCEVATFHTTARHDLIK